MKKILITGAPGFAASHLIEHIMMNSKNMVKIYGTKRIRSDMYRLDKKGLTDSINWFHVEMTDTISVLNLIQNVMPDQIYHLAAQDYVKSSWESPIETFDTNVNGLINLYEAVRKLYPRLNKGSFNLNAPDYLGDTNYESNNLAYPKILVTSTSESYGFHPGPINEDTPQRPINPYGISKMTMDLMAQLYAKAYQIPTVITRAFNITGWGRNDPFVDSNFAKQIAMIERGDQEVLKHGNLQAKRSFFDVKDAVEAYYKAMNAHQDIACRVFNFGPAGSITIQTLLDMLIGLANCPITIEIDRDRMRPVDTNEMICDSSKARAMLGWEAKVDLRDSLNDLLNYWRERL